jgi:hypothetical protein
MKKLYKILLLCLSNVLFSQNNTLPPATSTIQMPAFSTPEVSKLFRYSDFPNINSIGGTDIEIPIYTIKLDGMEIPIKLKYDTKGVKVADIANDVGLGWSLIYGGNIVKEIKDTDDFLSYSFFFDPNCNIGGFEDYLQQADHRISRGYFDSEYNAPGSFPVDYHIDSSPDFYLINAPGLNDKFYITINNNPSSWKINFLNNVNSRSSDIVTRGITPVLNTRASNPYYVTGFQKFKIENNLGYEYSFDVPQGTAITFYPQTFDDNINLYPADVNTWRLGQIKSPYSSKTVNYVFESFSNTYLNPTLNIPNQGATISDGDGGFFATGTNPKNDGSGAGGAKVISTYNLNNNRIKKIRFDDGAINFTYSTQRLDYNGNVLSKIEVVDKNEHIIKSFDLTYSYFQPANPSGCNDNYTCLRLRLDNIKDSSSGNYTFHYGTNNSDYLFPKRTSSKVDFLGFFNNNSSDLQFFSAYPAPNYPGDKIYYYPQLEKDNYLPFQLNNLTPASVSGTVDRSSNENSLIGLLTNITYPTGGSLSVQYENDYFDYMGMNYKLGTARIKKFTQNFNDGTTLEKNYSYNLDNGKSSGQIAFFNINRPKIGLELNSTAYVLYSKVEELITGKGKTISEYSNFDEFPDLLEKHDPNISTPNELKTLKETKFPYINVSSQSHRRGLLTQKTIKNNVGTTLNKEIYQYKNFVKDSLAVQKTISNYKSYITSCGGGLWGFKYVGIVRNYIRASNSFLTKAIKETYLPNGTVTETSDYSYNEPDNLMIKNQNNISDGKITETKYQYPKDLGQTFLIGKNILGTPLITTTTFKKDISDQGKVISKAETVYPLSTNIITGNFALPLSSKSYNLDNSQETNIIYDKYDSKGNLQQYTTKNGTTSIIWGYNQTQPIAKIQGALYDNIKNNSLLIGMISASDVDSKQNRNNDETSLLTVFDGLRTNSDFKNYKISTYTYDPLIGLRSETQPNGIRENYIYDSANRLEKVIDVRGRILKEYKYNYAPKFYNTERSQMFTKNNCASNQSSSQTYNYIVPFGKYISNINQSDADQLAQTDINNNGQNTANSSLQCNDNICTVYPSDYLTIYYSSFQEITPNHIKAVLSLPLATNFSWTNGVNIGTLGASCRPISSSKVITKTDGNGRIWEIFIYQHGTTVLTLKNGSISSNGQVFNLTFEYDK